MVVTINRHRGVLLLGLDLTTKLNDGDTHQAKQVASSIAVIVHASVKGSSHILANTHLDVLLSTGVLVHKLGNIIDDTLQKNPLLAIVLAGVLVILKAQDGEIGDRGAPLELCLLLEDLFLNHLE